MQLSKQEAFGVNFGISGLLTQSPSASTPGTCVLRYHRHNGPIDHHWSVSGYLFLNTAVSSIKRKGPGWKWNVLKREKKKQAAEMGKQEEVPSLPLRGHGHTALLLSRVRKFTSDHLAIAPMVCWPYLILFPSLVSFLVVHVETGRVKETPLPTIWGQRPTNHCCQRSLTHNGHCCIFGPVKSIPPQPPIVPYTQIPPSSALRGRPIRLLGSGSPLPHPNKVRDGDAARCFEAWVGMLTEHASNRKAPERCSI